VLHAQQSASCNGLAGSGYLEPLEPLKAGHIVGKERAYFLWSIGASPFQPANKPYLVAGDAVAVVKSAPGYVCVAYPKNKNSNMGTNGWLPANQVKIDEPREVPAKLKQWVGTWRSGTAEKLIIRLDGNALHVEGHAWWQGRSDPHFGEFSYNAAPIGNFVTFGNERDCQVQLLMLGNFIAAQDNHGCGGTNVTFSGFYVRHHK